jgi:hypothetical protein
MDFQTWRKVNESLQSHSLGIKTPRSTFMVNEKPTINQEISDEEVQSQIRKSNQALRQEEETDFVKSFDEYIPFKETPRIGTPEFEAEFMRSLGGAADDTNQKFSDGIAVGEDVLVKGPTPDEAMPVVDDQQIEKKWDTDWLNWEDNWNI